MSSEVLARMAGDGHESVFYGFDRATGLRAIIAIHDTTLGPSLGGIRARSYASEASALNDVLRLAEAMTYKASLAGLDLGGGKAVVPFDPPADVRPAMFRALGRMVDRLGGAYVPTEDMGTTTEDLAHVRLETAHGVGLPQAQGGSGDPSPTTALGVLGGMRAALVALGDGESLAGRRVAIQGVGKVGSALAALAADAGAEVTVADVDAQRAAAAAKACGGRVVDCADVLFSPADILAPCAAGAILDSSSIPRLRCRAVVGGANNQLAEEGDARRLAGRGVLYVPDFAVNAGGLIHVADELRPGGYDATRVRRKAENIRETVARILQQAKASDELPQVVALRMAAERIERQRRTLSA